MLLDKFPVYMLRYLQRLERFHFDIFPIPNSPERFSLKKGQGGKLGKGITLLISDKLVVGFQHRKEHRLPPPPRL